MDTLSIHAVQQIRDALVAQIDALTATAIASTAPSEHDKYAAVCELLAGIAQDLRETVEEHALADDAQNR
jgi:hypothetical protein